MHTLKRGSLLDKKMPQTRSADFFLSRERFDLKVSKKRSKAEEIAMYYGFTPITIPEVGREDIHKAKTFLDSDIKNRPLVDEERCYLNICPEEKVAMLRTYLERNMHTEPQPVMLFYEGHFGTNPSKKNALKEKRFGLEIIGTAKSIAEAILIQTSLEILKTAGFENLYVDINSIGDRDSNIRFTRELTNYYRKNLGKLPSHCRQTMKKEITDLLVCENEACRELQKEAPKSISFLSEQSRMHFQEVLEYLETMNVPYKISNSLLGNRRFTSHTIFQIKNIDDKKEDEQPSTLATGVRYNALAKKIELKKDLPAIGVTIAYKKTSRSEAEDLSAKIKKPKIYFIQLGFEAKLKSLHIIETLRLAKIPVYQSLSKDKLMAQLGAAEHMKIPYTIIMGQKEALDNTVIVRNMLTRSQETVPQAELPEYLKKIK